MLPAQGGCVIRTRNVLFLCTGNSARSIMAEALLNREGGDRFRAFSAGSRPKGKVHPMTLAVLRDHGIAVEGLSSKSWDAFAGSGARPLDFIFTVCGNAAGETCPIWPGRPATAHWGIDDPAAVEGPGQRQAFETALRHLRTRIALLLALPIETLDAAALADRLRAIGGAEGWKRGHG